MAIVKFKGLLLKESLDDLSVLNAIKITKEEKWDVPDAAEFQPKFWTAIFFEGDSEKVNEIVKKFSIAIKKKWYLNISISDIEYVVFHDKVFRYIKTDKKTKREAIKYGKSIGIPERQLDW